VRRFIFMDVGPHRDLQVTVKAVKHVDSPMTEIDSSLGVLTVNGILHPSIYKRLDQQFLQHSIMWTNLLKESSMILVELSARLDLGEVFPG
jgi:hypothetical protein